MRKRIMKFFISLFAIMMLLIPFTSTVKAETITVPFFSDSYRDDIAAVIMSGKSPVLSKSTLVDIGSPAIQLYLDILKNGTYDENGTCTHSNEVILVRDVRLILFNGSGYAPFKKVNNPDIGENKYARFIHDKLLWCKGDFTDLATALTQSAPTATPNGATFSSDVELCGEYNVLEPRAINFVVNSSIANVGSTMLQIYDLNNNCIGEYAMAEIVGGTYTGYQGWADAQSFSGNPVILPVTPSLPAPTSDSTISVETQAIKNTKEEVVGITLAITYAVDNKHTPVSLRVLDPNGNVIDNIGIKKKSAKVTKRYPNLVTPGTTDKPYQVQLIESSTVVPWKSASFTFVNTSLKGDNNYSDRKPVITYSGLTGIPTYPQNTDVIVTIHTDIPSDIKVNGGIIASKAVQGNYIVHANTTLQVLAEAGGQYSELEIPVNEFTDEVKEPDKRPRKPVNDAGDEIDPKTGVVKDRNGNVKGIADGKGHILDSFGNVIGTYDTDDNANEDLDNTTAEYKEGEKLTQTGIDSPIIYIGILIMLAGLGLCIGGAINAKKSHS